MWFFFTIPGFEIQDLQEGRRKKEHLMIRRMKCTGCSSYHNELPDLVTPYKHYQSEVICGVIDEIITPDAEDSEDYPSMRTMILWLQWFQANLEGIENYLKSYCDNILKSHICFHVSNLSLLESIKNKYQNWFEKILHIIYNSGGSLTPI